QYNHQVPQHFLPQVDENQFMPQLLYQQMNQQVVHSNPYADSPQLNANRELFSQPQYVAQPSSKPGIEDFLFQFMTRQEQLTLAKTQAIQRLEQ
ncbi:hypothetical protein OVY35_24645, partial [Salmonella enterica subsp. enterica serovar 1,4,[5],12:i:-]|nr:hypothetical protein [Salmonella enterica subsp. enterica serovar 1,4,[5],12:i:-]